MILDTSYHQALTLLSNWKLLPNGDCPCTKIITIMNNPKGGSRGARLAKRWVFIVSSFKVIHTQPNAKSLRNIQIVSILFGFAYS